MGFETTVAVKARGKVKWFDSKKGHGFIEQDEGEDLFLHYTAIAGTGFRSVEAGDRVEFEIEETPRGPRAKNCRKL
jgi:CspA family cold shock protein